MPETSMNFLNLYFEANGLLLCNESEELPYLESVGGDWNGIVSLIEDGTVFYSKLYHGRVTYLSRTFYANIKSYKQRMDRISPTARMIYDMLSGAEMASTEEIKCILPISGKLLRQSMDELFKELLVTAVKRERVMNENWCSFSWATFEKWEAMHPIDDVPISHEILKKQVSHLLTDRKLQNILK